MQEQEYCGAPDCKCPLNMNEPTLAVWIGHPLRLCMVCFDLWCIAMIRPWFKHAQFEWLREQQRRQGLMPGGNYFGS